MTSEELDAIEARQKAATPPGRIIFESDIIEKDVPALVAEVRRLRKIVTFSDGELLALKIMVRELATYCREDIIGAITYTGAFHALPDDNGAATVALGDKLEMTEDEQGMTDHSKRIRKGDLYLDYGQVKKAKADGNARGD